MCRPRFLYRHTWDAGGRANGPPGSMPLLAYLHNRFGTAANTPVFTFDLVEPGDKNQRDLTLAANFVVWNPATHSEVNSWSIDANDNGTLDPDNPITVEGQVNLTGTSTNTYTTQNTGLGAFDFLVYAPTMNLSLYQGLGHEFHASGKLTNLEGGGEEAFITGTFAPPGTIIVPEPRTFFLVGAGLLAVFIKKKNLLPALKPVRGQKYRR